MGNVGLLATVLRQCRRETHWRSSGPKTRVCNSDLPPSELYLSEHQTALSQIRILLLDRALHLQSAR